MGTIVKEDFVVHLCEREVPVQVRHNPRSKQISMRVRGDRLGISVSVPKKHTKAAMQRSREGALDFVRRSEMWVLRNLEPRVALAEELAIRDGSVIPVFGVEHTVRHVPHLRGGAWIEGDAIYVTGDGEFIRRRVIDLLKKELYGYVNVYARKLAARVDRTISRISIKDTTSKWGSCSSTRALNFNWRLILAPEHVLRYLVAHEVAHLVHMNHGPEFWRLTRQLHEDVGKAEVWLKKHETTLNAYGRF